MKTAPPERRGATYRKLVEAARPLMAMPFPGRWRVFGKLVNNPAFAQHWIGSALRWTKCRNTGFAIPCDLSVFSGRIAWVFHHWYDIATQSVILTLVRPGGVFVDIGANVGMASLSAAYAAGRDGRIFAFEPNPAIAAINRQAIERNGLGETITLHNAAIASENGTMELFVPLHNHGEATLVRGDMAFEGRSVSVPTTDAAFLRELDSIDLIKIDVEGFELSVLHALQPLIDKLHPPIVCEVMDEHLHRSGTSASDLFGFLEGLGYAAFRLEREADGWLRQRAKLIPHHITPQDPPLSADVLFVQRDQAERVAAKRFVGISR